MMRKDDRGRVPERMIEIKPGLALLLALIALMMLAPLVSCTGHASVTTNPGPTVLSYTNITAEEAYEMTQEQATVLLDVRTQEEYDSGHIPDAVLISLSELELRLGELEPSRRILVYCLSGARSRTAASILIDNGFTNVYNMERGMLQWQASGFPVCSEPASTAGPEPK
jgi:rhodanese-related sulfurtransferase